MKDELRKYIQENKEEWQTPPVPEGLWDSIEKETTPKVVSIKRARLWVMSGATVAAAVIAGLFLFMDQPADNRQVGDPFHEVELFYEAQLTSKMEQLSAFEVDEELLGEIELLKEEYTSLKTEMEVSVNNEEILEQMMENYRWRLKIIERLLIELEEDAITKDKRGDEVEIY